ncbi:MAG: exodeoxyribonuclease III [Deltaproteobacteria bacterium]|nr:exodeoxyribonuclease III [Deltaproteobacteria bacterium]MCB9787540.1 exodeoxyribonuclease III [Deltaproteobacteria bacterium]
MKLVTWNVNSLKARADYVRRYLAERSPDVLCIQELKLEDDHVPVELFEEHGYHLAIYGQKQWNGVLIASREPITDVHRGLPEGEAGQSRLISARTAGLRLVNLYCPQGQSADSPKFQYKLEFYAALTRWLAAEVDLGEPLAVVGDLNVAPGPDDVWSVEAFENVPTYHPLEHAAWAELVGLGLHDAVAPFVPPRTFTFWDYRGGAFRFDHGMRIDHVLVSEALRPRVTGAFVDRDFRKKIDGLSASDHAPVGVELS